MRIHGLHAGGSAQTFLSQVGNPEMKHARTFALVPLDLAMAAAALWLWAGRACVCGEA